MRGIANKGFHWCAKGCSNFSCNLIGNRPNPLLAIQPSVTC